MNSEPAPNIRSAIRPMIRRGTTEEIIDLRHAILRVGLPRDMAYFEGDDEPTTRHVVAELNGEIVGCATLLRRPWDDRPAFQLRGMAVAPQLRGAGVGAKLLEEIERLAREESTGYSDQMWCNARVPAQRFYEREGWTPVSEVFLIDHAGPHVKMKKGLTRKPE